MSDKNSYQHIQIPTSGERITLENGKVAPISEPIIPFIRGDGIGVDIWPATRSVLDGAVQSAYGSDKKIHWMKIYAGNEACSTYGDLQYLPEETNQAIRDFKVAIKGPLTTPIGGGIRSINVALRQIHDLYACVRPCRYYTGVPSPHKHPEKLDIIVYRENTEDIYLGIEWAANTDTATGLIDHINNTLIPKSPGLGKKKIRQDSGIGIKPISMSGTERFVRRAIEHAIRLPKDKQQVTLVHKGNIMKFTEGAFRDWGYALAKREFRQECVTERESWILGNRDANPSLPNEANAKMIEPSFDRFQADKKKKVIAEVESCLSDISKTHGNGAWKEKIMINDRIADSIFQQIQTRPSEYSILATTNLNGDYLSDAAAAIVGGLGMGPGANIGDNAAIFEATHGTAPKHAGLDKVNPGSLILSGAMMLEFLGWSEAAANVYKGLEAAISARQVTYDLARLMDEPKPTPLSCSAFAKAVIDHF